MGIQKGIQMGSRSGPDGVQKGSIWGSRLGVYVLYRPSQCGRKCHRSMLVEGWKFPPKNPTTEKMQRLFAIKIQWPEAVEFRSQLLRGNNLNNYNVFLFL